MNNLSYPIGASNERLKQDMIHLSYSDSPSWPSNAREQLLASRLNQINGWNLE